MLLLPLQPKLQGWFMFISQQRVALAMPSCPAEPFESVQKQNKQIPFRV